MESETPNPIPSDVTELRAQCAWLSKQIKTILIFLIILSGAVNIFLLRQWQYSRRDLAAVKPTAERVIAEYQKVNAPAMDAFIQKLTVYGRTNRGFAPILQRYGINSSNALPAAPVKPVSSLPQGSKIPVPPAPKK